MKRVLLYIALTLCLFFVACSQSVPSIPDTETPAPETEPEPAFPPKMNVSGNVTTVEVPYFETSELTEGENGKDDAFHHGNFFKYIDPDLLPVVCSSEEYLVSFPGFDEDIKEFSIYQIRPYYSSEIKSINSGEGFTLDSAEEKLDPSKGLSFVHKKNAAYNRLDEGKQLVFARAVFDTENGKVALYYAFYTATVKSFSDVEKPICQFLRYDGKAFSDGTPVVKTFYLREGFYPFIDELAKDDAAFAEISESLVASGSTNNITVAVVFNDPTDNCDHLIERVTNSPENAIYIKRGVPEKNDGDGQTWIALFEIDHPVYFTGNDVKVYFEDVKTDKNIKKPEFTAAKAEFQLVGGPEFPTAYVINGENELISLIDELRYYMNDLSFYTVFTAKYDDEWFKTHQLVLAETEGMSSSIKVEIRSVRSEPGHREITVGRTSRGGYTHDLKRRIFFVELEKGFFPDGAAVTVYILPEEKLD